jgi:hypothetical protein
MESTVGTLGPLLPQRQVSQSKAAAIEPVISSSCSHPNSPSHRPPGKTDLCIIADLPPVQLPLFGWRIPSTAGAAAAARAAAAAAEWSAAAAWDPFHGDWPHW